MFKFIWKEEIHMKKKKFICKRRNSYENEQIHMKKEQIHIKKTYKIHTKKNKFT